MKRIQLAIIYTIVFLLAAVNSFAQDTSLVRLDKYTPGIVYDLQYAGKNNFMHQRMYPRNAKPWLRKAAADSLKKVQDELQAQGLGLKIFDAYRPWSVTNLMWEKVKDDRYAADPKKGSNHNRGIAIDLTIIDRRTGKEWDMGTGFDNFSDTAHHDFQNLSADVLQKRKFLRSIMEKHGFKALETEWWHYSLKDGTGFKLLNLSFDELKKFK
jgi:D-alanyl-D-alanine dipeptidase